jgi:hypothetical protein
MGKFMSLFLRHQPEIVDIKRDHAGWIAVDEPHKLTFELLEFGASCNKHSIVSWKIKDVLSCHDIDSFLQKCVTSVIFVDAKERIAFRSNESFF